MHLAKFNTHVVWLDIKPSLVHEMAALATTEPSLLA